MAAAANGDRAYRKIINSWCMYDWANSAFATTIMAAMFPPFYRSLATTASLSEGNATARLGVGQLSAGHGRRHILGRP
jgi:MFS-type transporter involved in bile tolerance (Atg22 family)